MSNWWNINFEVGTNGDDIITTGDGNDIIISAGGDDVIVSGDGDDLIFAGSGDDTIDAGDGNDIVFAGSGDDTIFGGNGHDLLYGQRGDDIIYGGTGNDFIYGGSNNDYLFGGSGHDLIIGGSGNEYADGGSGDDVVLLNRGDDTGVYNIDENRDAYDYYNGGSGTDTLVIEVDASTLSELGITSQDIVNHFNSSGNSVNFSNLGFDLFAKRFENIEVNVASDNLAPIATNDSISMDEDNAVMGNLITDDSGNGVDSDPDGDPISVIQVNNNAANVGNAFTLSSGLLVLVNSDGSYDIDPNGMFDSLAPSDSFNDSFTYTIADDSGAISTASVSISIAGLNDAPVANFDFFSTDQNVAVSGNVLTNDVDVDSNDTLSVIPMTNANLTLNSDGSFIFDPLNDFDFLTATGQTSTGFNYTVVDSYGATDTSAFFIEVFGQNDAPTVLAPVAAVASEDDAPFNVDLLEFANDVDSGDVLMVNNLQHLSGDASGITNNGNSLTVDPSAYNSLAAGESELINYSYDITDLLGALVSQTATITIMGANDTPSVLGPITAIATEDDAIFNVNLLQGASDPDTSDTLNVSNLQLLSGDDSGITINGNSLDVNPTAYNSLNTGESEIIEYSYDVDDGNGGTVAQSATITVNGITDDLGPLLAIAYANLDNIDGYDPINDQLIVALHDTNTDGQVSVGDVLDFGKYSDGTYTAGSLNLFNFDTPNLPIAVTAVNIGQSNTIFAQVSDGAGVSGYVDFDIGPSFEVFTYSETSQSYSAGDILGFGGNESISLWNGTPDNAGAIQQQTPVAYSYNDTAGVDDIFLDIDIFINNVPTVSGPITAQASEDDAMFSVDLLQGASDPDYYDVLNVSNLQLQSGDDSGVTINGNSLEIDPDAYSALNNGESEVIQYSYDVDDGNGGTVAQTAEVTINGVTDVAAALLAVAYTNFDGVAGYDPMAGDQLIIGLRDTNGDGTVSVGDQLEFGLYPTLDPQNPGQFIYTAFNTPATPVELNWASPHTPGSYLIQGTTPYGNISFEDDDTLLDSVYYSEDNQSISLEDYFIGGGQNQKLDLQNGTPDTQGAIQGQADASTYPNLLIDPDPNPNPIDEVFLNVDIFI